MDVTKFNEKLNKLDGNVYIIEEIVTPTDGVFEGVLKHDNVELSTLNIYTGSKLTGDKINTYVTSTPSLTPWKTHIKIYSNEPKLYITYETTGDTVEAEDVNNLQDAVNETQNELNKEVDRAIKKEDEIEKNLDNEITRAKAAEKVLTDSLNTEINKAKKAESDEATRAKSAEKTLTDNLSKEVSRASSAENNIKSDINTNRPNWNEAYNKRHTHSNKNIIDSLGKNDEGDLTFEGGKIVSTTVNGLADDITIEGGNNITISKEGNKLIIAGSGSQEKIVTNTPISINASDWLLDTNETPNVYKVTIKHNLNDSNIIVSVYNSSKFAELAGVKIVDNNSIELRNYEAIDCKVVINSSGQPTEVIDDLNSSESTKALSAKQGNVLKQMISNVEGSIVLGRTFGEAQPIGLFFKIID